LWVVGSGGTTVQSAQDGSKHAPADPAKKTSLVAWGNIYGFVRRGRAALHEGSDTDRRCRRGESVRARQLPWHWTFLPAVVPSVELHDRSWAAGTAGPRLRLACDTRRCALPGRVKRTCRTDPATVLAPITPPANSGLFGRRTAAMRQGRPSSGMDRTMASSWAIRSPSTPPASSGGVVRRLRPGVWIPWLGATGPGTLRCRAP